MDSEELKSTALKRINDHPLSSEVIVRTVLKVWNDILTLSVGDKPYRIGKDLFPRPQLIGMLLHELISIELGKLLPGEWKGDEKKNEKDLVFLPDNDYSIEIKTSSSDNGVYGNRSYVKSEKGTKLRDGYFLVVNFERITPTSLGYIKSIRFGYLNKEDWIAQKSETGQQSRLSKEAKKIKVD